MSFPRRAERFVFGVSVAVIALVAGVAVLGYQQFRDEQTGLATRVVDGVGHELSLLLDKLRTPMRLFALAENDLLEAIRDNPDDLDRHESLRAAAAEYFPDYYAVSLASPDGRKLYLDDFGEEIGDVCRSDIRTFAAGTHPQKVFIHPGPGQYHFDLMVPWGRYGFPSGILFLSFRPDVVAELLTNSEIPGQSLLVLRKSRPGLVEIDARGSRADREGDSFLSLAEIDRILHRTDVADSDWELVALPEPGLFVGEAQRLAVIAAAVIGVYLLMALFMLRRIRAEEAGRAEAERALRSVNQTLEERVVQRTDTLRKTVRNLEQEIEARRGAQKARQESERLFRTLIEDSVDIIAIVDQSGMITYVSPSVSRALGYAPSELKGKSATHFVHERDLRRTTGRILNALKRTGVPVWSELRVRNKDGDWRVLEASFKSFSADSGGSLVVINARDITERKRADVQRRKLSSAVEQTADLVMITDRKGVIEYVNPAFSLVTGYAAEEAIGHRPSLLSSGVHDEAFYRQMWNIILAGRSFREVMVNRRKDGSLYYEEKTITPLKDGAGTITHFISTGKDITERMEVQDQLQQLAHHDPLTGLPNRALMRDRLVQALSRARREGSYLALLFMDLDNFKVINDTLGHRTGDRLLHDVAERLQTCLREKDTIARLGGDEFVVILEDLHAAGEIASVAQKLVDSLAETFRVDDRDLFVTTSIGITLYPNDGGDLEVLISNADAAMYQAKARGGNRFQFFTPEMATQISGRLELESDLRRAQAHDEWELHYQPRVRLSDNKVVAAEALLRWQRPERGLIWPSDFINSLEQTGLVVPVGQWVLHEACQAVRGWRESGLSDLRVSINLTARQLHDQQLLAIVERVLRTNELPYDALEFEITEGSLLEDEQDSLTVLRRLRAQGASIAIDDFGTGYSSLSYLKRLPVDRVKIDRSFISAIPSAEDAAIARAIIELSHSLGLKVTAEGVENQQQLDFLREQGCDEAQGFFFARPLTAVTLESWLTRGRGVVTPLRA